MLDYPKPDACFAYLATIGRVNVGAIAQHHIRFFHPVLLIVGTETAFRRRHRG
jgi:hypothetical protein